MPLVLALLVSAGGYYWLADPRQEVTNAFEVAPRKAAVQNPVSNPLPVVAGPLAPGDGVEIPRPDHPYRDTVVDGDVSVDADGHFLPDQNALRLFDYFFIESGRLADAKIEQQIRDWLASRLQQPALAEAEAFLGQYLQLRQLAEQAYSEAGMPGDPMARLQLIRQLQQEAFGPELAEQLYGEEYRRQHARVMRMQALASGEEVDPTQGLSQAENRVYQRTQSVLAASAMAAAAGDEAALWEQRSEAFGYDAAYRLAELDERRAHWDARLAQYREAMEALGSNSDLNQLEREQQEAALLEAHFNPTEQRRVRALQRIDSNPVP